LFMYRILCTFAVKFYTMKLDISYVICNADLLWKRARWNGGNVHCSCGCGDYYVLGDGRYKCKACGKVYSDTTGTLLHYTKLPKWKWLWVLYKMSTCKGVSTMELSRDICVNYSTAHLMQQKVRYLMEVDNIKLEGDIRIDEAYIGGWSDMHFSKKMSYMKKNGYLDRNGKYSKSSLLAAVSRKKHHILSLIDSTGNTKIIHTPNPITSDIIKQVIDRYCINVNMLITDESGLYRHLGYRYEQSNHSKAVFTTKSGYSSNVCENRFSWVKRKWNGIYTHTSEKYLQLYLNQMAYMNNHIGEDNITRFNSILSIAVSKRVTNEDIFRYDYLSRFDYIDVYKKEEQELLEVSEYLGDLVQGITTKHKLKR